jgi:hypothetical protein
VRFSSCGITLVGLLAATTANAQELSLSLADGRATLHAEGVTARQILTEWARRADVRVEGAERLPAEPLFIRVEDRPEAEVLGIVLRSASGVILAPRPATDLGASAIDRILILPTSVASAAPSGPMQPTPAPMVPPTVYVPAPDGQSAPVFDGSEPQPEVPTDGSQPPFPAPPPMMTPAGPPPSVPIPVPIAPTPNEAAPAQGTGPLIVSRPGVLPTPQQQQTTPGVPPVPAPPQQ